MDNFFSALMYLLFGKRWIKVSMQQGLKTALFIKRLEIEMNKERYETIEKELKEAEEKTEFKGDEEIKENKKIIEVKKSHLEQVMAQMGQMYDQLNSDKKKLAFIEKFKV